MRKWLLLGVLTVCGCGAPKAADPPYKETRAGFVRLLVDVAGDVDALALGDSVTEAAWLDGACGKTINAGVGASLVSDVREMAAYAIPRVKPETIIVAVGANHFWHGGGGMRTFEPEYRRLIEELPPARLIFVGIPNSEAGARFVQDLARERGAAFVSMPNTPDETTDGVHRTKLGAHRYRDRVIRACSP